MSRVGNHGEAEDVLQETFIRIHKYIHRYDSNRNALSWTFAIARNQIISQKYKRHDHVELDESSVESQARSSIEARNQLEKVLSGINKDERLLLVDRFLQEESYEEISSKRGLKPVNIR